MGDDGVPLEREEPLEHRDAQLTEEVQASLRNEVFADLEERSNDGSGPSYFEWFVAHALIGAIEVSNGLLKSRADKLPTCVDNESLSATSNKR